MQVRTPHSSRTTPTTRRSGTLVTGEEVEMHPDRARLAISLVDLTDLTDHCTPDAIDRLCARAREFGTAAVCVWPDFVAQAHVLLAGSAVKVATVVNFPSGDERPHAVRVITESALDDGADEIDVVLPYRWLERDAERVVAVVGAVRAATSGRSIMKVILETGELADPTLIATAASIAIECGADFIKTSTGKTPVSATPEAAHIMLDAIAAAGRPVGIKPSGGISTAADAEVYLTLAEQVMGESWLSPATFRFGASGLLNALIAAAAGEAPAVQTTSAY
jgi:deoxyribose-phosphate aldolase